MAVDNHLALLPLMLAGVPKGITELFREAGVPVAPLPRLSLTGAGTGRFVLFDSQNPKSAELAKRAQRHGLEPIDLRDCLVSPSSARLLTDELVAGPLRPLARDLLLRVKFELERRGGVWLRIADFPYPHQSAFCLAIEHRTENFSTALTVASRSPLKATHFVPVRSNLDPLDLVATDMNADWGWFVDAHGVESTLRHTCQLWTSRLLEFATVGLPIEGLSFPSTAVEVPGIRALLELNLQFGCARNLKLACQSKPALKRETLPPWIQFETVEIGAVPPTMMNGEREDTGTDRPPLENLLDRARLRQNRLDRAHVLSDDPRDSSSSSSVTVDDLIGEWLQDHYRTGYPIFVRESGARPDLATELAMVHAQAARFPFLWQTSLATFAQWWRLRRRVAVQVFRADGGYEIHWPGDVNAAAWGIEIWRGNHLATLPVQHNLLRVRDDGLIFQNAVHRDPGGFTLASRFGSMAPNAREQKLKDHPSHVISGA